MKTKIAVSFKVSFKLSKCFSFGERFFTHFVFACDQSAKFEIEKTPQNWNVAPSTLKLYY